MDQQAQRIAPVRLVRRRAASPTAQPPAPVGQLGNPIRELYGEVTNLQATWVDAVFWFALGVLGNALGEMIWDYVKGTW